LAKTFSIYRSSAGSGKTRTLAKEYLKLALKFRADYYKHILAVTFTNKASQEMKDRILSYLDDFANERPNELASELKAELGFDDQTFQQRSQEIQTAILHDYAQFSISTIDAFFQKVIRSFTRESGLVGDYRLEVEQDSVLEEVIDNLIDELGSDKDLTDWIVEFAKENLENEKAWDVRYSLIEFAKEIFREEFKVIEEEVNATTSQKRFFRDLKDTLWKIKTGFLRDVSGPAQEALNVIRSNQWALEDFSYGKSSGLITFFKTFANEKNLGKISIGERIRNHFIHPDKWPNKNSQHIRAIAQTAREKLVPLLKSIIDVYDQDYRKAFSAETVLKNLYVFGLTADISRKLKEFKDENNLMLLADAPKFLNGVIQDSDTPFIYEKVGSFYKNYLIDEFQDTSGMQWKNFQPLIVNSLDQGFHSLVVGDVKQAIYRWRGGDLNLLQKNIVSVIGPEAAEIKELDSNFRSSAELVRFNNEFFKTASSIISTQTSSAAAEAAYADVTQTSAKHKNGFVHIQLIREEKPESRTAVLNETTDGAGSQWKEIALHQIPLFLERLQLQGVPLRDIAILVRKNDEGQRIASWLLQYKNSEQARPGCRYDVVSNESLRIDGASSVNLLLGAMRYLLNPDDAIARAQLGYEYARLHQPERILSDVFTVANQAFFENSLPSAFTREKIFLRKLALLELTETLVRIFKLGSITGELVYLQAFQDLVLDFCNRERNDLAAFLDWWEDNKHKKSIQISGQVDAAQILTIHKSKGLQFPYVIIPFCSWSLDHDNWQAPNLWVRSEFLPFNNAGYLPVRYGKPLEETFFVEYYREEKTRTYLDNLNLLYVAFTRSVNGLIVTAPCPDVKGVKDSVAGLLYHAIKQNDHLRNSWDETKMIWGSREWTVALSECHSDQESIQLNEYHVSAWQEKLVIKKTGTAYFEVPANEKRVRINYGLQMHAVLSRIKNSREVLPVIEQLISEGLISSAESSGIMGELNEVFALPQVSSWFDDQWKVRTEVPIILPGGLHNRIDRLLTDNQRAVVIDFKTGIPAKTDNLQVLGYMDILRQMNYTDVNGFLLYLRDKNVVEVKAEGKQRLVKKVMNKDQLSLGF
jgi:ATP-dependent helicase/nuclease subunit A